MKLNLEDETVCVVPHGMVAWTVDCDVSSFKEEFSRFLLDPFVVTDILLLRQRYRYTTNRPRRERNDANFVSIVARFDKTTVGAKA